MSGSVMFEGRPWRESSPAIVSRGVGSLVHAGQGVGRGRGPSACLDCGWRGGANAYGERGPLKGMTFGNPLFESVRPALSDICPACGHADDYAEHERLLFRRPLAKVGRNDRCPCGSGRKFKKCCGAGA